MSDPLSGLSFSDAAPVPDHTASSDAPPPITPPPNPGAEAPQPRKRLLPGRQAGSNDNRRAQDRAKLFGPKEEKVKTPLPPVPASMAKDIEELYATAAVAVMPFDMELSVALAEVAPKAAEAWVELARKNHAVRRILLKLLETGAWGALIAAHMPLFKLAGSRAMGQSVRTSMIAEALARNVHPADDEPPASP
jgi:hypothetical protein